jgi:hypothetical protein
MIPDATPKEVGTTGTRGASPTWSVSTVTATLNQKKKRQTHHWKALALDAQAECDLLRRRLWWEYGLSGLVGLAVGFMVGLVVGR